jgi:RHS repeat-associated protein
VYYHHNDHLGTTQVMSDASAQAVWSASYEPFRLDDVEHGADALAENPLRFPGQYDDKAMGLGVFWYNYHRFLDPATGRYIQSDPLLAQGVRGPHPYAYANSSPTHFTDPTGLYIVIRPIGHPDFWGLLFQKASQALEYLAQDPGMASTIRQLQDSSSEYLIEVSNSFIQTQYESGWFGSAGVVKWNPMQGATCARSRESISPALALGHELAHAAAPWHQTLFSTASQEEMRVILGPERQAAMSLGEGLRTSHEGIPFYVGDPTERR